MKIPAGLPPQSMTNEPLTIFPSNDFDIPEGYYTLSKIVSLLRQFKNNPDAIQFIADMME